MQREELVRIHPLKESVTTRTTQEILNKPRVVWLQERKESLFFFSLAMPTMGPILYWLFVEDGASDVPVVSLVIPLAIGVIFCAWIALVVYCKDDDEDDDHTD